MIGELEQYGVELESGEPFHCELCGGSLFDELADKDGFWAVQCSTCKAAYVFDWQKRELQLAVWGVWRPEDSGAGAPPGGAGGVGAHST